MGRGEVGCCVSLVMFVLEVAAAAVVVVVVVVVAVVVGMWSGSAVVDRVESGEIRTGI